MSLLRSALMLVLAGALAAGCAARPPAVTAATGGDTIARSGATALDRAAVRAALAGRRQITIARFLAYRDRQVYPVNPGPGTAHLWIDADGNLCAAATIISGDWGRDATVAAVDGKLGTRLADVHAGRLADWMLTSGLTHAELVAIQVPGFEQPTPVLQSDAHAIETARLYQIYLDVERQLASLADENLELAVDRLLARPALARAFVEDPARLVASLSPAARRFATAPTVVAVAP